MHNQGVDGFIQCMQLIYNGKLLFYYLTEGYNALSKIISVLDAERFMSVACSLLENIIDVRNNGFLCCQNIDISFDHIYVDINTYKVKLIYFPVSRHFFQDESSFEKELKSSLISLISEEPALSSIETEQFLSDLSNSFYSLQELYNRIKDGIPLEKYEKKSLSEKRLKIVSINTQECVMFDIVKDNFIIGKNASIVDGVVSFNKMISRVHCKIIKNSEQYYVEDMQSSNGTYINHIKLQPHQLYKIKEGDIIRLANMDFRVVTD